jgi:hypothetical protein
MLQYPASDLALAHKNKIWIKYMNYKKIIRQWKQDLANENIKMPSFLWQGNLPNRASKIKRLLACHDIHLPWANVKLHLWVPILSVLYQKLSISSLVL